MSFNQYTKTQIGKKYEDLAEKYLKENGYEIIERNLKFKGGEIDLIAIDPSEPGSTLVFVEVRKRDSRSWEAAVESLSYSKQERLYRAIDLFILKKWKGMASQMRIDLIAFEDDGLSHFTDFMRRGYW